jgi:hypothetical protein
MPGRESAGESVEAGEQETEWPVLEEPEPEEPIDGLESTAQAD